jgi:Protein of unknown function (DUF3309)
MFPALGSRKARHLAIRLANLQCTCPRTEEKCHVYHDDLHHHTGVDPHRCLTDVPYSSGWGYYPSGGLGLIVLIIIILALTGRL